MMNFPLTTVSILKHVETEYGNRELVSYCEQDSVFRYNYVEFSQRVRQLANSLISKGIKKGDRVATLAWNTHRHMELYYAISGIGAICHTINPRYSMDQIRYIVKHAGDKALYFDGDFLAIAAMLHSANLGVEHFTCLANDKASTEEFTFMVYDEELQSQTTDFVWPELDENTNAGLCYTSGTTGNPKGVLYTHRSICLHSLVSSHSENLDIESQDVVCPIVPMFHVNAWGLPYSVPLFGASMVFAGANMQPEKLYKILDDEAVTYIAGVPTILSALLGHMESKQMKPKALHKLLVGGAAPNSTFIEKFEQNFSIDVLHGWGMTETSPVATLCKLKPHLKEELTIGEQLALKNKQGRKLYGVELKLVNTDGSLVPHDGKSYGDLLVRGAWVSERYYGSETSSSNQDGWFATGDIATIDENNYLQIVDRSKDVIKSGGEWISSVELENIAATMPEVQQAAVIGAFHPKWDERPLMLLVTSPDVQVSKEEVKQFLQDKIPSWWMPDDFVFVKSLPIGATGKIQKRDLRDKYQNALVDSLP
ncbi:fatty-acid--CoA ligase [Marinomonas agarivorans]|nr:fatty-acid--CoA ligase [Marinomonas agarivorans]